MCRCIDKNIGKIRKIGKIGYVRVDKIDNTDDISGNSNGVCRHNDNALTLEYLGKITADA